MLINWFLPYLEISSTFFSRCRRWLTRWGRCRTRQGNRHIPLGISHTLSLLGIPHTVNQDSLTLSQGTNPNTGTNLNLGTSHTHSLGTPRTRRTLILKEGPHIHSLERPLISSPHILNKESLHIHLSKETQTFHHQPMFIHHPTHPGEVIGVKYLSLAEVYRVERLYEVQMECLWWNVSRL